MPQVFSAITSAVGTYISSISLKTIAVNFLINTVLSAAYRLFSDSSTDSQDRGQTVTTRSPTSPHNIIYGRTRVGGNMLYMSATDNNKYLHMVIALAGHEIDAIENIYANDEELTLSSDVVSGGTYNGKIKIQFKYGTADQTAFADLVTATSGLTDGEWTTNHRVRGSALAYIRLEYDANVFTQGIPNFSFVIRGKKVYDPRTDTTAWSANPALCLSDYLTSSYGLNATYADEIDETVLIASANVCDEDVTLSAGGTENRYECHGTVLTSATPADIIRSLLSSMSGKAVFVGGKWKILAGSYVTPELTFDEDDLRDSFQVQTLVSRRNSFNCVKGTFISADNNYIEADFPPIISSTFIAEDNSETVFTSLELRMTSSASMAQRLAKIELLKARQQISLTLPVKLSGLRAQAGDIIKVNNTRLGWSEKTFEVESVNLSLEQDMGVDLVLREIASNVYDWSTSEEQTVDPAPNTTIPNPFAAGAPTSLTTSVFGTLAADGTYITNVRVSWTPSTDAFFDYYEVKVKLSTESEWTTATTKDYDHIARNVPQGTYDIEVYTVNFSGIKSTALTGSVVVGADTTAPSAPSGLTITSNGYQSAYLKWTNPTDYDFYQTIIYASTTNDSSTATEVGRISGTSQTYSGLSDNTTYYVWLKAIDFTGNISGFDNGQYSGTSFLTSTSIESEPLRNALVYFFYSTAQSSAPTAPTTSEVAYNFSTGTASISTSGWSDTFSPSALSSSDTGENKYWAVKVTFQETVYNGAYDETISSVFTWLNFDGLVTFTNLANGQDENGSTSTTLIDGGSIQTGTLTADKITAGSSTVASGKTFGLATNDTIASSAQGVGFFSSSATNTAGVLTISTSTAGLGAATTNTTTGTGAGNFWHCKNTNWNTFNTYAEIATYAWAGNFVDVNSGSKGAIALSGYDFYAYGSGTNYGSFTGAHDALMAKNTTIEPGDIVIDTGFTIKQGVSNTISKVTPSTSANQKSALGVFVLISNKHKPVTLSSYEQENGVSVINILPEYTQLLEENDICLINALGEGQINVCGQGGDIEVGDLIVTSDVLGKGMKQADDIVRSYTVAKARESVTFASPTEVKQVACIYVSG